MTTIYFTNSFFVFTVFGLFVFVVRNICLFMIFRFTHLFQRHVVKLLHIYIITYELWQYHQLDSTMQEKAAVTYCYNPSYR